MQVNAKNCSICAIELKLNEYLINETGYKSYIKHIEAMLKMYGMVNVIKNHIPGRAKILKQITRLTKNTKFKWARNSKGLFRR